MRIVRESAYNFNKTGDVKSSLSLGTRALITAWLHEMEIDDYTINEDLTIDGSNIILTNAENLTEFPEYIQFNRIDNNFICFGIGLTSLRGCPNFVSGEFDCSFNDIESLEGGPVSARYYICNDNRLKSLKGGPKKSEFINIDNNLLESLADLPDNIQDLSAASNQLKDLNGLPSKLGNLWIFDNPGKFTEGQIRKVCKIEDGIYL